MSTTPAPEDRKFKVCTGPCGKRKAVEKFEKDKRLPGGRTSRCRDCATEAQQGWRGEQSKAWKNRERARIREAVRALRAKKSKKKASKKKAR